MAEDQATATLKTSTVEKQPETESPRVMTTTKRMMVAIDESDSSFYALQWVIDHFSSLLMTTEAAGAEGDLLTVVHVQSPFYHFAAFPAGPGGATAVYASTAMIESVKKAQQETSAALLSRVLQMCRAKQVTYQF
uniref:UspA domain-containing protein n=1 Tax=Brassica oleracea var. oleracea TaxID=109376 RepID=A0A0D3BAV6_BRAOL